MLYGRQTWLFEQMPVIASTGVVGGPFEAEGNIASDFDLLFEDLWLDQDSYEKAQRFLLEESIAKAIEKGNTRKEDIQFILAGDLVNQMTPSSFASRTVGAPYLGIFSACATSMEGLALGAFIVNGGGASKVIAAASSHHTATERQFRYPTEYGGQKPPTAQWTATAAGAALIASEGKGAVITSATIGKVVDMGLSDPFNLGGAMAPAAVATILAHFRDLELPFDHYDCIVTGDLGSIGLSIARELLAKKGFPHPELVEDCGLMIYKKEQPVHAGASGAGCSAAVTYGHLLNRMKRGEINHMLIVATGALLSPLSFQQKETIPCIAHAVSIKAGEKR